MPNNLLFYSANSKLSYYLSTSYYDSIFYVWCSPVFDPSTLDALDPRRRIPGSSAPCNIYKGLLKDTNEEDRHSVLIANNRNGLKRGALEKFNSNVITADELALINTLIDSASFPEFKPLLYLIPKDIVGAKAVRVHSSVAAHPLSEEYIIENLELNEFEVICF